MATFQLKYISQQIPPSQVRKALSELPEDLDDAFEKILQRIRSKGKYVRILAFKILAWILHATRALTVAELLDALSVDEWTQRDLDNVLERNAMLDFCAGLIFIETGTDTVHFMHYGVQEYLLKQSSFYSIPDVSYLVKVCLTYLNFEDFECGPIADRDLTAYVERLQNFAFLNYASSNWAFHMKIYGEDDNDILTGLRLLCDSNMKRETMLQARYASIVSGTPVHINSYPRSSTLLHIIAAEGLAAAAQWFLTDNNGTQDDCLQQRDGYGRTPLHEASIRGHGDVVRQLIELNRGLVNLTDAEGATPLHRAAEGGHTEVIEMLLCNGADVMLKDGFGNNAFYVAMTALKGEAAQMIMEKMFQIMGGAGGEHAEPFSAKIEEPLSLSLEKARSGITGTLLHRAAAIGYKQGVRWLLLAGAAADAADEWGHTPLHRAATGGFEGIARILTVSTDCNTKSHGGQTALHFSAMYGNIGVVDVLLEAKADPSHRDHLGFTALHWAAAGGHAEIVEKLLPVTTLTLPSEIAPSPFHLASWGNFKEVQDIISRYYNTASEQCYETYTIESLNSLASGAWTEGRTGDAVADRQCKLSLLFKFWAGIEMKQDQKERATGWLDLDMAYIRDIAKDERFRAREASGLRHFQNCDHCLVKPIRGFRYRCTDCFAFPWHDLCALCFDKRSSVSHSHNSFVKVPSVFPIPSLEEQLMNLKRAYSN